VRKGKINVFENQQIIPFVSTLIVLSSFFRQTSLQRTSASLLRKYLALGTAGDQERIAKEQISPRKKESRKFLAVYSCVPMNCRFNVPVV